MTSLSHVSTRITQAFYDLQPTQIGDSISALITQIEPVIKNAPSWVYSPLPILADRVAVLFLSKTALFAEHARKITFAAGAVTCLAFARSVSSNSTKLLTACLYLSYKAAQYFLSHQKQLKASVEAYRNLMSEVKGQAEKFEATLYTWDNLTDTSHRRARKSQGAISLNPNMLFRLTETDLASAQKDPKHQIPNNTDFCWIDLGSVSTSLFSFNFIPLETILHLEENQFKLTIHSEEKKYEFTVKEACREDLKICIEKLKNCQRKETIQTSDVPTPNIAKIASECYLAPFEKDE